MPRTEDKEVKKYKAEEIEEYKGSGYGTRLLMKDVMEETEKLEEQRAEIEERGANKTLWSNIGSIVGTIAAVSMGPVGWLATGATAAGGAYIGSVAGRLGADAVKGKLGNMKKLEGSLMSKSKESQAAGVVAMNKGIEKDAQKGAILAGVGSGWAAGGGQAAGAKLSEWGMSDKLAKADIFTKWGGTAGTEAGSLTNPYGWGKKATNVAATSVNPGSTVSGKSYSPAHLNEQDLSIINPTTTSSSTTSSTYTSPKVSKKSIVQRHIKSTNANAYTGTTNQNNFITSRMGIKSGELVNTMTNAKQDSSLFTRGGLFDRLNEKGAFEIWMREKGLLST